MKRKASDSEDIGATRRVLPKVDRRRFLMATGALGVMAGTGCATAPLPQRYVSDRPMCVLSPEQTEGPFYLDTRLQRADVREDRPGVPLDLQLKVVDSETCAVVPGAIASIWHCDALGNYSAYNEEEFERGEELTVDASETFLRGFQPCDSQGCARFSTIVPGWYTGRAPHIHFKVHLGEKTLVTSQLYFPTWLTQEIYSGKAPYRSRGPADVQLAEDGILEHTPSRLDLVMDVVRETEGFSAVHTIGIQS